MPNYLNITAKIKKILHEIVDEKQLRLESIVKIYNYQMETHFNDEPIEFLMKSALIKEPKNGKCYFFDENFCYVSKSKKTGVFYYWSVNEEKKERFCLTIVDLFTAFKSGLHSFGVSQMLKTYGCQTGEEKIIETYRMKYQKNLEALHNPSLWRFHPYLFKKAEAILPDLELLNKIGAMCVMGCHHSVNGEHVIFSSARYLADLIQINNIREGARSARTLHAINFLTLLGFITKIPICDIPDELKRKEFFNVKNRMAPSYYVINEINGETLMKAELKIAQINEIFEERIRANSKEKRLSVTNISFEKVFLYFGIDEANRVFPNNALLRVCAIKGQRRKRKLRQRVMNIKNKLPF